MVIEIEKEKKKEKRKKRRVHYQLMHTTNFYIINYQESTCIIHGERESNVPELKSERRDETSLKLPFDTLNSKKKNS